MYISALHGATVSTEVPEWWQMCDSLCLKSVGFSLVQKSVSFFNLIKPLMNILSNELHVLYFIINVVCEALSSLA